MLVLLHNMAGIFGIHYIWKPIAIGILRINSQSGYPFSTPTNEVLARNPSYIFFELRDDPSHGPVGSLNVALTPARSVAVDRSVIPLGAPVWLQTTLPDDRQSPFDRLMLAQDTGGAIKGHVRADVFWGQGDEAELLAGLMKQQGRLFVLLPRGYPLGE